MQVTINGKEEELSNDLTVQALVETLGLSPVGLVIEYNHNILKQTEWPTTTITNQSKLELISFVGGG